MQLAELGKRHEVVACDLRGHGATPGRAHECTSGDPAQAEELTRSAILAAGYEKFAENVFRQMFLQCSPLAEAALARMKRLPVDIGIELWTRMVRWDATPLMVIQSTWINPERKRLPLKQGQSSPWLELLRTKASGIEIIPGVGHFPQLEAPDLVNRLIEAFVRR